MFQTNSQEKKLAHQAVVSYINCIESCNKVLQIRQMEKFILMKQFLLAYFLHHLKSYGTHVCPSNEMHIGENTPVKSLSNVGINIWDSHSCKMQFTLQSVQ